MISLDQSPLILWKNEGEKHVLWRLLKKELWVLNN